MSNNSVQDQNRALAQAINDQARSDPHSPYMGKFVGIANGQVVAIADDLDELVCRLRLAEPDPAKTFCLEAGVDYDEVQDIWGPTLFHRLRPAFADPIMRARP